MCLKVNTCYNLNKSGAIGHWTQTSPYIIHTQYFFFKKKKKLLNPLHNPKMDQNNKEKLLNTLEVL